MQTLGEWGNFRWYFAYLELMMIKVKYKGWNFHRIFFMIDSNQFIQMLQKWMGSLGLIKLFVRKVAVAQSHWQFAGPVQKCTISLDQTLLCLQQFHNDVRKLKSYWGFPAVFWKIWRWQFLYDEDEDEVSMTLHWRLKMWRPQISFMLKIEDYHFLNLFKRKILFSKFLKNEDLKILTKLWRKWRPLRVFY